MFLIQIGPILRTKDKIIEKASPLYIKINFDHNFEIDHMQKTCVDEEIDQMMFLKEMITYDFIMFS